MVKVVVTDREGRILEIDARPGFSLMESLRDLPASVDAICGGMCACATCHVLIDAEWMQRLPPRAYEEQQMLEESVSYDPERSRLSCQIAVTEALEGLRLTVAPEEF